VIRWILTRDLPDLPVGLFMDPTELVEGDRYRHPGRRRQWLLGRITAKALLERHLRGSETGCPPLTQLRIRRTEDGWPMALFEDGRPLPVSLSISHSADRALCALCSEDFGRVGADLEAVEPRSAPFLEDWYTDDERACLAAWPAGQADCVINAAWCIKEAVLKAQRTGLNRDPRTVQVESLGDPDAPGWQSARVRTPGGPAPEVHWRRGPDDRFVLAIARVW
jgi:4'-phosphopantetheinyl transferase